MRMRIALETRSPVSISRGRAIGNELQTIGHIPASTWRGALAAYFIEDRGLDGGADQDADFHRLFLSGESRFGDLRFEGREPWPLSARGCTRYNEHPVRDLLVDTALGAPMPLECSECGSKIGVPRGEGFEEDELGRPIPHGAARRITAHTAISGRTLRVRDEQFFATEVLERGQSFEGEVRCSDDAGVVLKKLIGEGIRLTIGRAGTRGCGDAKLSAEEEKESGTVELSERLSAVNAPFADDGDVVFICSLLSPAVVLDEWLTSRSWLSARDIEDAAGEPGSLTGYELAPCYSRTTVLSGWNAQARLPKSDTPAIAAGSAFLFRKHVADRNAEIDRLVRLLGKAQDGIGERWEEGLGEAVFCHSFHMKRRPQ